MLGSHLRIRQCCSLPRNLFWLRNAKCSFYLLRFVLKRNSIFVRKHFVLDEVTTEMIPKVNRNGVIEMENSVTGWWFQCSMIVLFLTQCAFCFSQHCRNNIVVNTVIQVEAILYYSLSEINYITRCRLL